MLGLWKVKRLQKVELVRRLVLELLMTNDLVDVLAGWFLWIPTILHYASWNSLSKTIISAGENSDIMELFFEDKKTKSSCFRWESDRYKTWIQGTIWRLAAHKDFETYPDKISKSYFVPTKFADVTIQAEWSEKFVPIKLEKRSWISPDNLSFIRKRIHGGDDSEHSLDCDWARRCWLRKFWYSYGVEPIK